MSRVRLTLGDKVLAPHRSERFPWCHQSSMQNCRVLSTVLSICNLSPANLWLASLALTCDLRPQKVACLSQANL